MMMMRAAVSSAAERLEKLLLDTESRERGKGDMDGVVEEVDTLKQKLLLDKGSRGDMDQIVEEVMLKLRALENDLISLGDEEIITSQQVTQLAFEIEEAAEVYYQQQQQAGSGSGSGSVNPLRRVVNLYTGRREMERFNMFNKKIDDILLETSSIVVNQVPDYYYYYNSNNSSSVVDHQVPDVELDHREWLASRLLDETGEDWTAIAVCGRGGIGKTSLVESVYNDASVASHFQTRGWINVDKKKEFMTSVDCATINKLFFFVDQAMSSTRYLLVIEDVPSVRFWEATTFLRVPEKNIKGNRIVITTRNRDVADHVARSVLQIKPLSHNQSWETLKSKLELPPPAIHDAPEQEIGRQIVTYCEGLPFYINVLGSTLKTKHRNEWEKMLLRIHKNVRGGESVLSLCYMELPFELRPCFLYLGLFPKLHVIPVEKLYLLWIDEGLIPMEAAAYGKTKMEVAQCYLNNLVNRCLVEKEENSSCSLHDRIREFCISIANKELLLEVIDHGGDGKRRRRRESCSPPRLSVHLNKFEKDAKDVPVHIADVKHIRSLLFFDAEDQSQSTSWPKQFSDLTEFQGTRVLEFYGVDFRVKKLQLSIRKLRHLRHLSFHRCYLMEFPSSFNNFLLLETLDLRVNASCVMAIPNILITMTGLRHLYLPEVFRVDKKDQKLKVHTLTKLEILENFNARLCDADDLLHLRKLQILTGSVHGENADVSKFIICLNENRMSLRHSSLVLKLFDICGPVRTSIVKQVLACDALDGLSIEGCLGEHIPGLDGIGSKLTWLELDGSRFTQDIMPILGQLPNLSNLVLCRNAFMGEMVCSSGFPRLTTLKLRFSGSLEKWEAERDVMPNLVVITIRSCRRLRDVPCGIFSRTTLKRVVIQLMPQAFHNKVKEMIADPTIIEID